MIRYLAPGGPDAFSGGIRKLYDHVAILGEHGVEVDILDTNVEGALDRLVAGPEDLLVVPEVYGDALRTLLPGVPRVSLNQNAHYSWANVTDLLHHPYVGNSDLLAVLVMSEHSEAMISYAFPGLAVRRLTTSAGRPEHFYLGAYPRPHRICFFGRKKGDRARQVIGILAARGALNGWQIVQMDGMTDEEVGRCLRTSAIFLSFSDQESFGSPPFEAMVCGAKVVGFLGSSVEYSQHVTSVPDDDVLALAQSVEAAQATVDLPSECARLSRASAWGLRTFSRDREVENLILAFAEIDRMRQVRTTTQKVPAA